MDYKRMSEFTKATSKDDVELIGIKDNNNIRLSVDTLLEEINEYIENLQIRITNLES